MSKPFDAEHPWNFFKEILVLNLAHREDRRKHIQTHLARFPNLDYTFFPGVFGRESKHVVEYAIRRGIIRLEPDETGEVINIGQVACIVSHFLMWEHCVLKVPHGSEGYWILILEDDVEFHPDFNNKVLYDYLQHLPEEVKYFKLSYQDSEMYSTVTPVNSHWKKLERQTFSTIAYAVHTDLLMPFLMNTYSKPLDWYPIHTAHGMADIDPSGDNQSSDFFSYDYYYTRGIIQYKYSGVYRGVARSFKHEMDSDINFMVLKMRGEV
jgi:GR25 family glycosyltransferase involved in LPS biosynthesis